jgi:hypothetical protein
MNLIAVGKPADPRGNVRYLVSPGDGRITMSIEGALPKVTHEAREMVIRPGQAFEIPVTVGRSAKLPETVRLEVRLPEGMEGVTAELPDVVVELYPARRPEGRRYPGTARCPS